MEALINLILGISVILVLFSIFGISFKFSKNPKWKKLDPKKPWGKPGSDIDQWCIRNPKTKVIFFWIAQFIVWLSQIALWVVNNFFKAVWAVFNKISPVKFATKAKK